MKRLLTGALAVLLSASMMSTAVAKPHVPRWLREGCRFQTLDDRSGYSIEEVHRTIRCATWRWYRGRISVVNCIADRESSFYAGADNPVSSASGVFQIVSGTWQGWRFNHEPYGWAEHAAEYKLSTSVWDARANVMIAVWQMARYGLGPWGYAC